MANGLDAPIIDHATRRLLLSVCLTMAVGLGFGLLMGVFYGLLTPIEWFMLPALLLACAGTALATRRASERQFLLSTRLLGIATGTYLLVGAANHLLWQLDPASSLVYLVWIPAYHVFIFAVVDDHWARPLSLGVLLSSIALQAAAVQIDPSWSLVDPSVTTSIVLIFVQAATIGMLQIMVRYRTRYAASRARAITLQQGEQELKAALDEARAARQDAEEQHRLAHDAHQRLATIVNALDVGIALFQRNAHMLLCNRVLADFLDKVGLDAGQSPTAMEIARALDQFGAEVPEDPEGRWTERFQEVIEGSTAHGQMWLPDGRSFLASGSLLDSGDGLFTVVETTELERSRHALTRLQKMESLGRLVGGVAHDFNNLFSILLGSFELLRDVEGDGEHQQTIVHAMVAIDRGSALTRQLLSFAGKGGAAAAAAVPVGDALEQVRTMVAETCSAAVSLAIDVPDELPTVLVDESMLHSTLVSLVMNACEAMPEGGRISIRCAAFEVPATGAPAGLSPGRYVEIACADSGIGIEPDVLDRVLEPFFSTKSDRHGVGLGLSGAYGFAREAGGDLQIESSPGLGTTVRMYLPAAEPEPHQAPATVMTHNRTAAPLRALVVEDNAQVRRLAVAFLERMGFMVTEAAEVESARQAFGADHFDLLFSDIILPDGNGYELAAELRRRDPGISVLMTSGYAGSDTADADPAATSWPLLSKPYRYSQLQKAVQEVLG